MPVYINNILFKTPARIMRYEDDFKRYNKKRAVSGKLRLDIIGTTKKTRQVWTYKTLTAAQLTAWKTYIETGFYRVQNTDAGYEYDAPSLIELDGGWSEAFAGTKDDISFRISEQ